MSFRVGGDKTYLWAEWKGENLKQILPNKMAEHIPYGYFLPGMKIFFSEPEEQMHNLQCLRRPDFPAPPESRAGYQTAPRDGRRKESTFTFKSLFSATL